jgi:hypothetical protein
MEQLMDCVKKRAYRQALSVALAGAYRQSKALVNLLCLAYLAGFGFYFGATAALAFDQAVFDVSNLVRVIHISGGHDANQ